MQDCRAHHGVAEPWITGPLDKLGSHAEKSRKDITLRDTHFKWTPMKQPKFVRMGWSQQKGTTKSVFWQFFPYKIVIFVGIPYTMTPMVCPIDAQRSTTTAAQFTHPP